MAALPSEPHRTLPHADMQFLRLTAALSLSVLKQWHCIWSP